ncbi:MAG: glycosyltransferase family 4 protein [Gemmatimonadetes bacterium]|nr:glycosyltransferase family 4 protein [Gemmatimonadota bacterium]
MPYPPKAGVLLRSYNLVRELARTSDVDLVAFTQRNLLTPIYDDVDAGLREGEIRLAEFCRAVDFVPLPSDAWQWGRHRIALNSLLRRRAYDELWLRSREYRRVVTERIARGAYDVVHIDTIGLMQYADLVPPDVPVVLDHHNIESHLWARRGMNSTDALRSRFFATQADLVRKLEERVCGAVDLNVVCSDTDRERLLDIVPEAKVEIVPNGVDVEFFDAPAGAERAPRVIFVGTLDWYPKTAAVRRIAHDIWPLLRVADERIECDIIGGNPPADLVELAERDDRFHVHGFVDDIHPWMESALCYLCPIRDGGGTKLKILDALAMSKAIVADPIACEGIEVTDGVDILLAEAPEAYVEHVMRLKNADVRTGIERAARKLAVDRYSFRSIGRDFHALLEGLHRNE